MRELKKSFWDFVTSLGSSFLALPLMVFSEAIQARYLGPEKYGQIALIISAISLFFLFGLSWAQNSIIRFGKEEFIKNNNLRRTTGNFLLISAFSFVFVLLFYFIFKNRILKFLNITNPDYAWIIFIGLILFALKNFIFEVLKVIRLIKLQAILMRLANKVIILIGLLPIVFRVIPVSIWYVICVFLFSDLFVVLISLFFIKFKYIFPVIIDKNLLIKMTKFSFPLLFTAWTFYITTWVDTYVIKYFMKMKDVGIYQAAYKILSTLNSILIQSIIAVTTPLIMVFKTNNEIFKIKNFYMKRIVPQISFFSMIVVSIILIISDEVFHLIYGQKFNQSILPFKILITTLNLSMVSAAINGVRISFDMTKMMLYMGIFAAVVNFVADVILVKKFGILGASWASFTVFSLNPIIWYLYIYKKMEVKRYLSLFFPLISVFILIINIYFNAIRIRIILTFILIVLSFYFGKIFNLFNKNDIKLLDRINMPVVVKKVYFKLVKFADRSN